MLPKNLRNIFYSPVTWKIFLFNTCMLECIVNACHVLRHSLYGTQAPTQQLVWENVTLRQSASRWGSARRVAGVPVMTQERPSLCTGG